MYKAIEDLLDKAQSAQSDDQFNSDLDEHRSYLDDKKYDAASGKLDSLANDDSLTDDQKKQVKELQKQLSDAQQQEKQQEENSQKKAEQRDAFSKKMDELESDDLKISSAENQEDELARTASSFEQWDNLLGEMYDYLATVLNADQYAPRRQATSSGCRSVIPVRKMPQRRPRMTRQSSLHPTALSRATPKHTAISCSI